jgi:Protein of unknown function (DUF3467)
MTEAIWSAPLDSGDRGASYTNSVIIGATQWDLTIDFQLTTPAPGSTVSDPQFVAQRVARIVMSPTHAKVFAQFLGNAVGTWEGRFGPLPEAATLMPQPPAGTGEGE